jgi:hypothetical protein
MGTNPLANLGDLTKPATVLIEKISEALGGIFRPYQIVRVARAEAEAEQIQAESQIQVTDLQRRALYRFLKEEAKKQLNIEEITKKALPLLDEKSSPQNVEDDWITNFFDKCRLISDSDMQHLWSRILAGEANRPGAFSKRTVTLLADLEKSDAAMFTRLGGFCWMIIDSFVPLVFDLQSPCYNRCEIHFESLSHLESLGLIKFTEVGGFMHDDLPSKVTVSYYGRSVELTLRNDARNELVLGRVLLTRAGQQLVSVCGSTPVEGFFDFVYTRWAAESLVPKIAAKPGTEVVT